MTLKTWNMPLFRKMWVVAGNTVQTLVAKMNKNEQTKQLVLA